MSLSGSDFPHTSTGSVVTVNCEGKSGDNQEAVVTCTSAYGWTGSLDWADLECKYKESTNTNSSEAKTISLSDLKRKNSAESCWNIVTFAILISFLLFAVR